MLSAAALVVPAAEPIGEPPQPSGRAGLSTSAERTNGNRLNRLVAALAVTTPSGNKKPRRNRSYSGAGTREEAVSYHNHRSAARQINRASSSPPAPYQTVTLLLPRRGARVVIKLTAIIVGLNRQCSKHISNTDACRIPWFDGAFLQPERPPSVKPIAKLSFRSARKVPSNVRVFENRRAGQIRWFDDRVAR